MKSDRAYLEHMSECLDWVLRHTADGRDAFLQDRETQSAMLRELQTLAESSTRLSAATKAAQPAVPWDSIAAFRNVVVHDYLGLDLQRVWQVVERDLPPLRSAIASLRQSLPDEAGRTRGHADSAPG